MTIFSAYVNIDEDITKGGFGWWCESDAVEKFTGTVDTACHADLPALGQAAYAYLEGHYTAEKGYEIIMEKLK
ncbi:MAG: hypothetical protein RSA84_17910 [Acinetobacter sp.]